MKVRFSKSISCELIDEVMGNIPTSFYWCKLVLNTELDFLPQEDQQFRIFNDNSSAKFVIYNLSDNCVDVQLTEDYFQDWFNSVETPVKKSKGYLDYLKQITNYQKQGWEIEPKKRQNEN